MLRNLAIVGLAFAAIHLIGTGSAEVYDPLAAYVKANGLFLIFSAFLGVGFMAAASMLFANTGLYNLLFALARVVYDIAQFAICAAFFAALILWYDLGINFWVELGAPLGVGMFIMLFGGAFSLRLYDFNYPIKETLVQHCMLPVISLVIMAIGNMIS
ncbi:MAG: hypothetical protein OEY01_01770 [Desulfobulbaceae bacterium]|nr:hypothetical protein [Desulfobulbaceae bacterium]HIJ78020.1 hypothetical protein [Deltaproteobacteria bacterium]